MTNGTESSTNRPQAADSGETVKAIAQLTRSKGQTIDNDSRILVPLAIVELLPIIAAAVQAAQVELLTPLIDYVRYEEPDSATASRILLKLEALLKAEQQRGEDKK